jgi:hypothetical protein
MCDTNITAMWRKDGTEVIMKCGDYFAGGKLLCRPCEEKAKKDYPQGWRYYPGDVCKHGTYVGGCGIDWMCGKCEMGE